MLGGGIGWSGHGRSQPALTDATCGAFISDKTWTKFSIPKSSKEDDGSADVKVDVQGKDTDLAVHLVDQNGWKIERITCEG